MVFLRSACLLAATPVAFATKGTNVFEKVVDALDGALQDAIGAQKSNDAQFKKVECHAEEEIQKAKMTIPELEESIDALSMKQKELRSENEFLSLEANDLDENIVKMKQELGDRQQTRNQENEKYNKDKNDFEMAVGQLKEAIKVVKQGTANLLQISSRIISHTSSAPIETALLQTAAKTGSSGQVIGILEKLQTQFEGNLVKNEASEREASALFADYVDRITKQINSEEMQSKSNKGRIASNKVSLDTTQESLRSDKKSLKQNKLTLKEESEKLAEHKEFHTKFTAENEGLKKALNDAINLLSSNEATKTFQKASDHMVTSRFPDSSAFLQLKKSPNSFMSRLSSIRKHSVKKQAGDYAWHAIFNAVDDMTVALQNQISEADEKFANCEEQMKAHHESELELNLSFDQNEAIKAQASEDAAVATESIAKNKHAVADLTAKIRDNTEFIRDAEDSFNKEKREADDASALFQQAIVLLKSYESNKDLELPKTDAANTQYDTSKISTGTETVVAIIEKVEGDMMNEIKQLEEQTAKDIEEGQKTIAESKEDISNAKEAIGQMTTKLANANTAISGADVFLKAATEGLAAEKEWWGPAKGHKLPTPGQECIAWLGRHDFAHGSNLKWTETDKLEGNGKYHDETKSVNEDIAGLSEMKEIIKGIQNQYIVASPDFASPAGSMANAGATNSIVASSNPY